MSLIGPSSLSYTLQLYTLGHVTCLATTRKTKRAVGLFWVLWSARPVRDCINWSHIPLVRIESYIHNWNTIVYCKYDSRCHRISVKAREWYWDWKNFSWITPTLTILPVLLSTNDTRNFALLRNQLPMLHYLQKDKFPLPCLPTYIGLLQI